MWMLVFSILLSGMNIVALLRAAVKFGKLELMVVTMWDSFNKGHFGRAPNGIAHDLDGDDEGGER